MTANGKEKTKFFKTQENTKMKTLKDHPHYETLKRLHPEAVGRGFVGEWEDIENCVLDGCSPSNYIDEICSSCYSGIAGAYLSLLYHKMNIEDLTKLPDEFEPPRDHVCADGVEYYYGVKYWFSHDGKEWFEANFDGYIAGSGFRWRGSRNGAGNGYAYISKTNPIPAGPTPEQIAGIKALYEKAVRIERIGRCVWQLDSNCYTITNTYFPNSKDWPDVIELRGVE